jgi:hypothetical protein
LVATGVRAFSKAVSLDYIDRGAASAHSRGQGEDMKRTVRDLSIEEAVLVPDLKAVRAYLKRHDELAAQLPAVCDAARKEFGAEAELALELYRDPEISDHYLTLYVRLDCYDSETMSRIDRVSGSFERQLAQTSGYLLLTTDFRPPRGANGV